MKTRPTNNRRRLVYRNAELDLGAVHLAHFPACRSSSDLNVFREERLITRGKRKSWVGILLSFERKNDAKLGGKYRTRFTLFILHRAAPSPELSLENCRNLH